MVPIALARFRLPLTRPAWIKPPAFKILSLSISSSGLWSRERLYACNKRATITAIYASLCTTDVYVLVHRDRHTHIYHVEWWDGEYFPP